MTGPNWIIFIFFLFVITRTWLVNEKKNVFVKKKWYEGGTKIAGSLYR